MKTQLTYVQITGNNRDQRNAAIDIVEEIDYEIGIDLCVFNEDGKLVYRMETDAPISETNLTRLTDAGATWQQF